jgi:hypothetical protein
VSSIPHAPFELVIIYRDHKVRVVRFETLRTALASAASLRDSLISSWRLSVLIDSYSAADRPMQHHDASSALRSA